MQFLSGFGLGMLFTAILVQSCAETVKPCNRMCDDKAVKHGCAIRVLDSLTGSAKVEWKAK